MKMKLLEDKGRSNRRLTVLLTFATVVLLFFASAVAIETTQLNETVKNQVNGQDPIEVTEDFTLTEDLSFSTHGLIIKADGVTIDGAGHKIIGSKSVSTCEWITETDPNVETAGHGILNEGYDDVVIKNVEIENFATGIWLHGTGKNPVIGNRIENCVIYDNGLSDMSGSESESVTHGIHMTFTRNTVIINNEIYNNEGTGSGCGDGGNGIHIFGGLTDPNLNTITGNKIHHNAKAGVWAKMKVNHINISNNEIYENGNGEGVADSTRGGIVLRCKMSNYNTIEGNDVHDNNGDGLYIGGNNNDIRNNDIITNSHYGVNFARSDGSKNNHLYRNVICSNHEYDVYNVHTEADNTGDENTGTTAYNYRDEGTTGDTYFTYSCGSASPDKPSKPSGPTSGKAGAEYTYTSSTTDPDGDQVKYGWDWNGDEVVNEWTNFYNSGETVTTPHTWTEKGTYNVRVKAQDKGGLESEWSDPLSVTMPKSKVLQHDLLFLRLLEELLQRFPALLDWGLIY